MACLGCAVDPSRSAHQLPALAGVWKDLPLPSAAVNIVSCRSAPRPPSLNPQGRWALRRHCLSFLLRVRGQDRYRVQKGPGGQPTPACRRALRSQAASCPLGTVPAPSCITARPSPSRSPSAKCPCPAPLSPALPSPSLEALPSLRPSWCQMNSRACFHG